MPHSLDVVPRPGLALGRYPERRESTSNPQNNWLDRTTSNLLTRFSSRTPQIENIITQINAVGKSLAANSDTELLASTEQLRANLLYAGWNDDLAIQSFALVRETSKRLLGICHYESQLHAGWVMLQGKLAEMQTGEGKTLAATLPAATAALCSIPVHVITANDYLAARDAEHLRPLYEALGLTVANITEDMDFSARRSAYACDITYCTNKQIAFDYLRDRVERDTANTTSNLDLEHFYGDSTHGTRLMLRGLCFAIIDEADSVLIDEARTPLVLSQTAKGENPTLKTYQQTLELADRLIKDHEYTVLSSERQIQLTTCGSAHLARLASQQVSPGLNLRHCEELVLQALRAQHLFIRDRDYVVRDNKIDIVDNNTGRITADRSWELSLQHMIETKENCKLSQPKETLARISYQRFFGRYLQLSGMSGTAREVTKELAEIYGLSVETIAPQTVSKRIAMPQQVYRKAEHAIDAMVCSALEHAKQGRPVLIGTRSVQKSEQLTQHLSMAGISVRVLNARQDADEADIIAQGGQKGQITVATGMAGRGTDITLGSGVAQLGGLHVIIVEHNDAARLDRQLFGRCARQGDPGSYQIFSSLEDDLPQLFFSPLFFKALSGFSQSKIQPLPTTLGCILMRLAQRRAENQHRQFRIRVEMEDCRLRDVLSFSGQPE